MFTLVSLTVTRHTKLVEEAQTLPLPEPLPQATVSVANSGIRDSDNAGVICAKFRPQEYRKLLIVSPRHCGDYITLNNFKTTSIDINDHFITFGQVKEQALKHIGWSAIPSSVYCCQISSVCVKLMCNRSSLLIISKMIK